MRFIAAAALLAAAGAAHAGLFDDDEARKRIEELRSEQVRATREVTDRLQRLEEGVKNLGVVDLLRQIEQLNAEIARIRGQLEVLANQNEQVAKRQRDFYLDLDSRLKRLEGGPSASSPQAPDPGATAPAASTSAPATTAAARPPSRDEQAREMKAYDAASGLFRRNDFASAAEAFNAFIKDHPASALVPNAMYWIGICHANLRDFKAALAAQESLLAKHPQSPKAPDALLAIAALQAEQGDSGSARNTLEDIIARYPGSEAAGKARTRLAALRR